MIAVKKGIRATEVRFSRQHVLFVEGRDKEAIDPKVLDEFFEGNIQIEPLGPSFSVRSVAEALYTHHPTYYFLIDRDHYDDAFIERCWKNFPNPDTHNLLVWRRREIENYFLEPAYLFQSRYCKVSQGELEKKILQFTNERLFLDVANYVITSIREELKRTWIEHFSNPAEFSSKEKALLKLKNATEFDQYRTKVAQKVSTDEVERRFHKYLDEMTGDEARLVLGQGKWLDMIKGKKVLAQVVSSGDFQVLTTDGTPLDGRAKINEVVKDILRKDVSIQPEDFLILKQLINARLSDTN